MNALVNATVKFSSREVNTKFGKRINLVLVTDAGEEIKQWGEPDDSALTSLAKNQKVILLKENDKYKIVPAETASPRPTIVEQPACENDLNPLLCDEARRHINFYNFCLKEVQKQVTTLKDEESIRTIATSVFIQSMRSNV
jgi:hypothetical protein